MRIVTDSIALRPMRVAEVSEYQPAERARKKADRVSAQRRDGSKHGLQLREEQLVEDQRRCGSIQQKVVPLDTRAEDARPHDLAEHAVQRDLR